MRAIEILFTAFVLAFGPALPFFLAWIAWVFGFPVLAGALAAMGVILFLSLLRLVNG